MSNEFEDEIEMEIDLDEEEIEVEIDFEEDDIVELDLDDEIEVELNFNEDGTLNDGFDLLESSGGFFLEDDSISSDEIAIALTSEGLFESDLLDDTLLIGMDEIEIDLGGDDTPKYEVSRTPAQTVLALYKPSPDESFLVETSNKEIHDAINDVGQYERNAYQRLRDYLDLPIFDIFPPKRAKFRSDKFRRQQDFRSLLIADFVNHRSIPSEYTEQHIVNKVFEAWEAEGCPELTESRAQLLEKLIRDFIMFADSTFDEAQRSTELAMYKESPKTLRCPEVVGNFTYVCKCGAEYEMPEGRPTLTFLIKETGKIAHATLMNEPIPCETCQVYLYLPTSLVNVLNIEMDDYIKRIKATYEHPRIFRPALEDLKAMIPSDAMVLFELDGTQIVDSKAISETNTYNEAYSSYSKLINMWMNSVSSEQRYKKVMASIKKDSPSAVVAKQITMVDFGFVADLYAHQYAKTIIHYLEGFSCFSLTKESRAYYRYCDIQNFNKKPFPVDYAIEWIYDNAPHIASLNNLYDGDTNMDSLNILPEYIEALNYVICLHLLSKPELMYPGSDLAKWVKNPSATTKDLKAIYKSLKTKKSDMLVTSHRDLLAEENMFSTRAWSDTYLFLTEVIGPIRYSNEVPVELRNLATKALRANAEDFYGVDIPEKLLVRPTLMFEEFKSAFKDFGFMLFRGVICDSLRHNLAKGLHLFQKNDWLFKVLKTYQQPVTDVSTILISDDSSELDEDRLLFELIIKVHDLPDNLNQIREDYGHKAIFDNLDDYRDFLMIDSELMDKFGGILKCYL